MNFGQALEELKKGGKAYREGWNGKNQFIFLVRGNTLEYRTDANLSSLEGMEVEHSDVVAIKTSNGVIQVGWLATQTDMLADDWMLLSNEE